MRVALLLAAPLALVACAAEPTGTPAASTSGTTAADLLGARRDAIGSPIKVGLVSDGRTDALDDRATLDAATATARFVNEHLGGIDGHVLELDTCETGQTPSGGATCGTQMARDQVGVVLISASAQASAVFDALDGSGIPLVVNVAVDPAIIIKPGAFELTDPLASLAGNIIVARDHQVSKVGLVIPDVPSARGTGAITEPVYAKAGLDSQLVLVPLETADMSPQIQQAINGGVGLFDVAGTDAFVVNGVKTIKQLGFTGPIVVSSSSVGPQLAEQVPGGSEGILNVTNYTNDPKDPDVELFGAVMATYAPDTDRGNVAQASFSLVLALQRALTGNGATDATAITGAMAHMPTPVPLPLGGGITFQCGTKPVSFAPNICTGGALVATLAADGSSQDSKLIDTTPYTNGAS